MKSSETDILIVAGHTGAGPDHWQTRLITKLKAARLVEQDDWLYGSLDVAIARIVNAVATAPKPVVFVGHSVGSALVPHAISALTTAKVVDRIKGAFLVTPPSEKSLATLHGIDARFQHIPRDPLPFPSVLVASSNDPYATLEDSADMALAWGSKLIEAGAAGHINMESGHGPWPEGMMSFAGFLSRL
jgi:predicted alpha/beta hydrolase family esterase